MNMICVSTRVGRPSSLRSSEVCCSTSRTRWADVSTKARLDRVAGRYLWKRVRSTGDAFLASETEHRRSRMRLGASIRCSAFSQEDTVRIGWLRRRCLSRERGDEILEGGSKKRRIIPVGSHAVHDGTEIGIRYPYRHWIELGDRATRAFSASEQRV